MYDRPMFKMIKQIFPERVASTTSEYHKNIASSDTCLDASKILGLNFNLTIEATSGNVTLAYSTGITSTQGYILTEGTSIDLKVPSVIYLCSNSTTAKFQAIAWDA